MEEEARIILRTVLADEGDKPRKLATSITSRFEALGGIDLEIPDREPIREPPEAS